MVVVLGTNSFVDCDAVIAVSGRPLLRVVLAPLRVTLITPDNIPSGRVVHVADNVATNSSHVRVVQSAESISVFWDTQFILVATVVAETTVNVHVDLRPLGINIYDDANGLNVGQMHFAGSTWSGGTALSLA